MIIVMRHDASAKQIAEVVSKVESRGLRVNISRGEEHTIIGVIGDDRPIDQPDFHIRAAAGALHHGGKLDQVQRVHEVFLDRAA